MFLEIDFDKRNLNYRPRYQSVSFLMANNSTEICLGAFVRQLNRKFGLTVARITTKENWHMNTNIYIYVKRERSSYFHPRGHTISTCCYLLLEITNRWLTHVFDYNHCVE